MKSVTLNFLEPSGPLQASNGTALPLPVSVKTKFQVTSQNKQFFFFTQLRQLIAVFLKVRPPCKPSHLCLSITSFTGL